MVWFKNMALGENSLSNIVKTLTEGLHGRYTNQSLRRSSATRLFQAGYEEDMVCRLSGHRSSAVRIYKELATHQKQAISAEIQCIIHIGPIAFAVNNDQFRGHVVPEKLHHC